MKNALHNISINTHMIHPGQEVILIPKTRHAKNCIAQHGKNWFVQKVNVLTNRLLLRSSEPTFKGKYSGIYSHDLRWVNLPVDEDFEVEGLTATASA